MRPPYQQMQTLVRPFIAPTRQHVSLSFSSGENHAPHKEACFWSQAACIFFAYSRTAIWAPFAKQEGHQIASTITTCTRTNEEPCIPGPLCSCTDTDLCGTLLPAGRSNFGGSPRTQSYMIRPDLADNEIWRYRARRSDPTFTRTSPG